MLCAALAPVAEEEIVAAVGAQAAVIDSIRAESTVNQLPDVGTIQIQMAFPALLLSRDQLLRIAEFTAKGVEHLRPHLEAAGADGWTERRLALIVTEVAEAQRVLRQSTDTAQPGAESVLESGLLQRLADNKLKVAVLAKGKIAHFRFQVSGFRFQ